MSKHTPAPWRVHHETYPLGGLKVRVMAGRGIIAEIFWPNEAANAHLIAAAPVLLQTIREFVAVYNNALPVKHAEDADYMLARVRDIKDLATRAINEATGAHAGALAEVARSNDSKMVDGAFLYDGNGKVIKPKGYNPPNLNPYIKGQP